MSTFLSCDALECTATEPDGNDLPIGWQQLTFTERAARVSDPDDECEVAMVKSMLPQISGFIEMMKHREVDIVRTIHLCPKHGVTLPLLRMTTLPRVESGVPIPDGPVVQIDGSPLEYAPSAPPDWVQEVLAQNAPCKVCRYCGYRVSIDFDREPEGAVPPGQRSGCVHDFVVGKIGEGEALDE